MGAPAMSAMEYQIAGFMMLVSVTDGKAVKLIGLYDDGMRQPSPRTK